MKRSLFFFLTVFICFSIFPKACYAVENFILSYDVTYTASQDGTTQALFKAKLTNTSSQYYATSYKMNLGFNDINNVLVTDSKRKIEHTLTKTNFGYTIFIPLREKTVGKDKELTFTISFDTKNIAKKAGNVWEINVPKIANQKDFATFNVHIKVPNSFGEPLYIKPFHNDENLDFTKEQLDTSGISILFGQQQYYTFNLKYHLKNDGVFPTTAEIAIPPSTSYQDVIIEDISPKPLNVRVDTDGNWLAKYSLNASEVFDVEVLGKARVNLFPKKEALSKNQIALYTKPLPYWEQNNKVKMLSQQLKTPEKIYNYVVKNVVYDFSRITAGSPRVGAKGVLENPSSGVCLEFTDLFIAIARAAGIPAREVNGFAYTQNETQRPLSLVKDVLHAWPEYYDLEKQTWIMVDPTWENTTGGIDYFHVFDFDHLAFVIKGENSTYPYPAGDYKLFGKKDGKDINVSFAEDFGDITPNATYSLTFQNSFFAGFKPNGFVKLQNNKNIPFPPQEIEVIAQNITPTKQKIKTGVVAPYGYLEIPIIFNPSPLLTNSKATVTIQIDSHKLSQTFTIKPLFFSISAVIGGVFIAICIFILSIIAARSRNLSFFR